MASNSRAHTTALDRLLELTVLLNGDMTRSLAREGLTVSRTHLLWELHARGPVTQRQLADAMRVSARTITGLVDGLVATGFVLRQPHPHDRRAILVTFTDHGAATVRQLAREQERFSALLFADLPEDQLRCLVAGIEHVVDRLRATVAPSPAGEES